MGGSRRERKGLLQQRPTDVVLYAKPALNTATVAKRNSMWLEKSWSSKILTHSHSEWRHHLWLEISRQPASKVALKKAKYELTLRHFSLGAFISPGSYNCHWKSQEYDGHSTLNTKTDDVVQTDSADDNDEVDEDDFTTQGRLKASFEFNDDSELIDIRWIETESKHWRMETTITGLAERIVLVQRSSDATHLYLFMASQPKIHHGSPPKQKTVDFFDFADLIEAEAVEASPETLWERDVRFGTCQRHIIGNSSVIHMSIDPVDLEKSEILVQRLHRHGFVVCVGDPKTTFSDPSPTLYYPSFSSFDATYAWYCLVTRGFTVTDQICEEIKNFLTDKRDDEHMARIIYAVGNRFDESVICCLKQSLADEFDRLHTKSDNDNDKEDDLEDSEPQIEHLVKVRRLLLTPSVVRGLPAEHIVGNRVVRKFDADRFLRVVIRDEDLEPLSNSTANRLSETVKAIADFLPQDLLIGGRRYHFLGCSNSQLREHGFWMYASDGQHTVDGIRKWMGDLTHERCVATYVSRLGQFFSSSRQTITVDAVEHIDDVERNGYCFTDGIGQISRPLADKVSKSLGIRKTPSAFQIRYAGCKGVVSVHPALESETMRVRKSMEKFRSDHKELEVVQITSPGRLYLNRQVIVLMSGLGIPDNAFDKVLDEMLQRLANTLVDEEAAAEALASAGIGVGRSMLLESHIALTREPFLYSVLRTVYEHRLGDLIRKTRIELSADKGRIMMGTVDETGSLKYGEVFVQYSTDLDHPQTHTKILECEVVIAKNPCFHPGDMRKFTAVSMSPLKHMVDCIVFPASGDRPHPNEMSGSDLDGDMYFVCWEQSLLPPNDNKEPMNYTPQQKGTLDRPVTEEDMVTFIGNYIDGDKLGVIANSHLAHADGQGEGIFSPKCIKLAQMHSDAVDFPKTGYRVVIPFDLRPQSYPHYMQKRDKPIYTSKHILGKLFDTCHSIASAKRNNLLPETTVDGGYVVAGYQKFVTSAKRLAAFYCRNISRLMAEYGVDTEAEIVTGNIIKLRKQRRGTIKKEHVEIAQLIRNQLQWVKGKCKRMFFEEFGGDTCELTRDVYRKLSAVYQVSHSQTEEGNPCQGLPWLFVEHLVSLKAGRIPDDRDSVEYKTTTSQDLQHVKHKSMLGQMSQDIVRLKPTSDLVASRHFRSKAFDKLTTIMATVANSAHLVVFGSTVTHLDNSSSTLDVLVVEYSDSETQKGVMVEVGKSYGINDTHQYTAGKPLVINDGENKVKVVLYPCNDYYTARTIYILAWCASYRNLVPALKALVAWGSSSDIVGRGRKCIITQEQLVLMFIAFVSERNESDRHIADVYLSAVTDLFMLNHFHSCDISTCSHISADFKEIQIENVQGDSWLSNTFLLFFHHYSCLRGQVVHNVLDPVYCSPGDRKKLLELKDYQYNSIAERMQRTYHLLAQSGSINVLLDVPKVEDGHLVMTLPRQLATRIILVEKSFAEKLKKKSKADVVTINRKRYREAMAGLVLEAWGTSNTLQVIQEIIADETKASLLFVKNSLPFRAQIVDEGYIVTFDGLKREHDARLIVMQPYMGPHQPSHDRFERTLMVPCLIEPDAGSRYAFEQFAANTMKQVNLILQKYDQQLNGELRAVISYGTYYVSSYEQHCGREYKLDEFESMITNQGGQASNEELVNPDKYVQNARRKRGGPRGRGRTLTYSIIQSSYKDRASYRSSFIPAGNALFCSNKLDEFLSNNGFIITNHTVEYRPSVKLCISGQRSSVDCVVVMDGSMNLKEICMPDVKWLCINIVSAYDNDRGCKPCDIRFKIHSRFQLPSDELIRNCPQDFKDLVANHRRILRRDLQGKVFGVHPKYKELVRFMRYKETSVYELDSGRHAPSTDHYLHGMKIRVNRGKEFSRPSPDGIFGKVDDDRTEVTVIPEIPDMRDDEKMKEFLQRTWHFARKFRDILL